MNLMQPEERAFAQTLTRIISCNHFLPERIQLEGEALGSEFVDGPSAEWNLNFDSNVRSPNVMRLSEKTAAVVQKVHQRLRRGGRLAREESEEYQNLVYYHLYQRYRNDLEQLTVSASPGPVRCYDAFSRELQDYLQVARQVAPSPQEAAQIFAGSWQFERAFHHIFSNIVGSSASIARLRAAAWESIFTCNFSRYRQGLFQRMHEITTLITGPSGTGKELVAKAIASSGYISFDPIKQRFVQDHRGLFFPLNLSALPSSLIESELFVQTRGIHGGAARSRGLAGSLSPRRKRLSG
jgi:transcriptional regulator with PAS, ATPase and Fis domain